MAAWGIEWHEDVGEEPGGAHFVGRRHDGAVQDDGERTPPLAAGTVDNSCLSKTSSGGDRDLAAEIPCSLRANSLFLGKNSLFC